jgi:RNA polymerase sigma-70 factor (ECF subfamily)
MALNRCGGGAHLTGVTGFHGASAAPAAVATALLPVDVVERAGSGDKVAFARLVAAYHADLVRVAYVVSGDEQLAQDAAQSAWAIAWRKLGTVRDPARVRPWLTAVAANEARQVLRSRRRETLTEIDLEQEGRAGDPTGDDPSDEIERVDLANALRHLKAEDRALLAMRFAAGFDAGEIAAARGMTASGVRGHLSRVIARLRKELGDD